MAIFIARYFMLENINPWPFATWTYSQGIQADTPSEALTSAVAYGGAFMPPHSTSIEITGVGVYTVAKGDKKFDFEQTSISGGVTITGSRMPLWNTVYSSWPAQPGRPGFRHWRCGFGGDDLPADNEWDTTQADEFAGRTNGFILANPDVLTKPDGASWQGVGVSQHKPHMRQFGARTPVGGRPGRPSSHGLEQLHVKENADRFVRWLKELYDGKLDGTWEGWEARTGQEAPFCEDCHPWSNAVQGFGRLGTAHQPSY